MLRVRPIHHTPHVEEWARLLTTLGLIELPASGGHGEFAAAGGKIRLLDSGMPWTELGFEIRDLDKFADWTRSDGTPVTITGDGSSRAGRITGPDGLSFLAEPVTPGDPSAGTEPGLIVLALWNTPDVSGASATLRNIGARPDTTSDAGTWEQFRAKNGGLVAAHAGSEPGAALSFEYAGAAQKLLDILHSRGIDATLVDEAHGRTVLVPDPDGTLLRISERLHGHTGHAE
ncbi:VOC family protein [Paeniglutamicibacter cryotolerans]|uniref:Uncharacterized protein n=1 Tax=Paeniglutamicibacter cryotolerans TaxID=670079 RepID=A0A839QHN7_9MICC|nr:VOC family protein [Paeniglutamicibacter cryotolerans]MBB2995277.1 hypothetical protein [Paeniglutamicibacter cryotolerans]